MIINLIIGMVLINIISVNYGLNLIDNIDFYTCLYLFLINSSFIIATQSMKKGIDLVKLTITKTKKTKYSYNQMISLNNGLIAINILFGIITNVISKLSVYSNISDPSTIGPTTSIGLFSMLVVLYILAFILLPQKYILSNLVEYNSKVNES